MRVSPAILMIMQYRVKCGKYWCLDFRETELSDLIFLEGVMLIRKEDDQSNQHKENESESNISWCRSSFKEG